jgi:hypothetical protein
MHCQKRGILALFFISWLLAAAGGRESRAEFYGTQATGLIELKDYKYPVYLYVPQNYKPDRDYALIITVPGEGENPEENIQFWVGAAKRKSMLVLAPTNIWPEELPFTVDEWLLRIKKDVMSRFRVGEQKVFLIGKEGGAHYASYLGTNYPDEFSAVALLGDAWGGRYEKILRPQSQARRQNPFFVAFKEGQAEAIAAAESRAKDFLARGYPVYMEKLGPGEEFSQDEFKKRLLGWLEENAESWERVMAEKKKGWRERARIWAEEFFRV